jgi:hypothetical protein
MMLAGSVFRDLLFRRQQCVFIAFDLLYPNGLQEKAMQSPFPYILFGIRMASASIRFDAEVVRRTANRYGKITVRIHQSTSIQSGASSPLN